ncbi:mitochondrial import inner membrane translocase subunit Tim8-like isoform X1 [Amphibalanus amphitrite]|uniref:mitochondrial import inner membrane translocase subunit Tim8-like isoform X1 n=1 Tax=Amphibalanus amphitrite TaxID=1232801 RepID=UPI001C927869|nr:mitochondrial import inner membrane translocase subunit Tim8-like isoform X1 [Amphibalanus amphitrite]
MGFEQIDGGKEDNRTQCTMDFGSSSRPSSSSFDSYSPGSSLNAPPGGPAGSGGTDKELEQFVMMEQQKAQFQAQVHKLNDVCWDRCVDKPSSKLDSRQENCLSNCVDRFVDVSLVITNRFAQLMQKQQGI